MGVLKRLFPYATSRCFIETSPAIDLRATTENPLQGVQTGKTFGNIEKQRQLMEFPLSSVHFSQLEIRQEDGRIAWLGGGFRSPLEWTCSISPCFSYGRGDGYSASLSAQ